MLENLTEKMSKALRNLRGVGKITEDNISDALKEVRTALLSADVHFKVTRQFIDDVKKECLGQEVIKSVTPGQMITKIIHDELVKLLGSEIEPLKDKKPLHILMVGLHGSGKTTSSAKLAKILKKKGYTPLLVACDIYRPAAIDQLETLANQNDLLFYCDRQNDNVPKIGQQALAFAKEQGANALIFDTAGRLQIDEPLIEEVKQLSTVVNPDETFLVADSALGQEAVNVAKHFHEAVSLTGIVLTKLDGDARGGAALSMKAITQVPIRYMATGEKVDDFSLFHADRMAQRILGMGDVVSLVEKAQEHIDEEESLKMASKIKRAEFTLEDFLEQMQKIKNMGPMGSLMKMMPGMGNLQMGDKEEGMMKKTEAIIQSMTPKERQKPNIINGSRRLRIANGSGTQVKDVNQLLKQFQQIQKFMKSMKGGKGARKMQQLASMMSGGSKIPGLPF